MANIDKADIDKEKKKIQQFSLNKPLWEWLVEVIIPNIAILTAGLTAVFAIIIQVQESRESTQAQIRESHESTEKEIEIIKTQILKQDLIEYKRQILDLILKEDLLDAEPNSLKLKAAKSLTSSIIKVFNSELNRNLINFLTQMELTQRSKKNELQLLSQNNFSDASLRDADLEYADLEGTDLRNAHLGFASLYHASLRSADLRLAYLRHARLIGADLEDAKLRVADLENVSLYYANLRSADLSHANLINANLYYANLYYANLEGANLYYANLEGANLINANLEGANLINMKGITNSQIKSACFWEKAIYEGNWDTTKLKWIVNEEAHQEYIEKLKQEKSSDPKEKPDCSRWGQK